MRKAAQQALAEANVGARRFEAANGLKPWSLRGLLDNSRQQVPSVDRAAEICEALGLEFYIGPPRDASRARNVIAAWDDPNSGASAGAFVTPWPVPMADPAPMAGEAGGFSPHGCAWFGQDFLKDFGLDPVQCEVIEIRDDEMAPALANGSVGLIDKQRRLLSSGFIYAIRCNGRLMARRAVLTGDGWTAVAEKPDYASIPWTDEIETVGLIVWTARMLLDEGEGTAPDGRPVPTE